MLYRIGSSVVPPSWCGIGGHFERNELNDARACVLRELEEEMRLTENDIRNMELRYITLRLKNGEVRQNYYFFADLQKDVTVSLVCNEGRPEWFSLEKVNDLEMTFTSQYVLRHYMETGRYTNILYGGIALGNGVTFEELNEF
jgi:8-oxo-dGTP diphosphatase